MIRILLVDDDPFFHTTFLSLVDWNSLGCVVTCQAENGQQAITMLSQHPVDVVITDMVMPGMSGVELIRYVHREYPRIKCVALSSFDDFDYVRQSLKEGALDYLLKHTLNYRVIEELIPSLSPQDSCVQKNSDQNVFNELLISMLHSPEYDPNRLEQALRELNVDFPNPPLLVVCVRLQNVTQLTRRFEFKERYLQFLSTATNIIQGALEHYGKALCVNNSYDCVYCLISNERFSSRLYGSQVAHLLKKNLTSILNRYCNVAAAVAVNSTCDNLDDVLPAFRSLEEEFSALDDRDYLQEKDSDSPVVSIRLDAEQSLAEWMRSGSFEDVRRTIRDEFESCRAQAPSRNAVRHISMEFLNLLGHICQDEDVPFGDLFPPNTSPYSIASRLSSFTETVDFITESYLSLYTLLHDGTNSGNLIVQNALRVIRSRYGEDISLSCVADAIHCNPTYLSRIFKSKTGKGFVQYLNDYRLSQARRLMDSEALPLRLIAQRAGFPNYNYFARIFKQRLGQTPQEYMKKRLGSDADIRE